MTLRDEIDITDRLRLMAIEREFYTKTGKPMHVNAAMTGWLTEAVTEIERLRAALSNEQLVAPECVCEARYGDVHTPNSPGRAWCQTHGFDCPNLALRGV